MLHPDREEIPWSFPDFTLLQELWLSTELIFSNKITWLLVLGPLALVGDATGILGEPLCFAFSGIALIPCAERLSFVTEQVAAHTNGTIGALLVRVFFCFAGNFMSFSSVSQSLLHRMQRLETPPSC